MYKIILAILTVLVTGNFSYSADLSKKTASKIQQQAYTLNQQEDYEDLILLDSSADESSDCSDKVAACLGKSMCCYAMAEEGHECYTPSIFVADEACGIVVGGLGLGYLVASLTSSAIACGGKNTCCMYASITLCSPLACCFMLHVPYLCYAGAKCAGNDRFVEHFEESQRCLPSHSCSFHNICGWEAKH